MSFSDSLSLVGRGHFAPPSKTLRTLNPLTMRPGGNIPVHLKLFPLTSKNAAMRSYDVENMSLFLDNRPAGSAIVNFPIFSKPQKTVSTWLKITQNQ